MTTAEAVLEENRSTIDRVIIVVLIACNIISTSGVFENYIGGIDRVALVTIALISTFYIIYSIASIDNTASMFSIGFIILFTLQISTFYFHTQIPINPLPLSIFAPIFAFSVFFRVRLDAEEVLRIAYYIGLTYALLYVLISLLPGLLLPQSSSLSGLLIGYEGRADRFIASSSYLAFVLIYSLLHKGAKFRVFAITLSLVAIYLTYSRVFQACLMATIVLHYAGVGIRTTSILFRTIFLGFTAVMLWGVIDSGWMPFEPFMQDASGYIRHLGYMQVTTFLSHSPIFGAGLPSSLDAMNALLGSAVDVYGADYGALGIWLNWGLAGVVLYILGVYFLTSTGGASGKVYMRAASEDQKTLRLLGLHFALYCSTAPVIFGGSGTVLFCLILAYRLRNR